MPRRNLDDLGQFTGSTRCFRHAFNRAVVYTEGVQYLAEHGDAYWLVDAIASHIGTRQFRDACLRDPRVSLLHFWRLAVAADRSADLTAVADSGEAPFICQKIDYTDFPLDKIDLWAGDNGDGFTLMLPSEY